MSNIYSQNIAKNSIKTQPPEPVKPKGRTVAIKLDADQTETLERARLALPDRPTISSWIRRIIMREARRALQGHTD